MFMLAFLIQFANQKYSELSGRFIENWYLKISCLIDLLKALNDMHDYTIVIGMYSCNFGLIYIALDIH